MAVFALLCLAGIIRELPEHYQRGLFTLADLCALILPLLVRGPFAPFIAFSLRSGPQTHGIDAAIWFLARCIDRREGIAPAGVPGHAPCPYALFDCIDDLGRHARVNVPFVGCGSVSSRHRETYLSRCLGIVAGCTPSWYR